MSTVADDNKPRITVDLTQMLAEMPSRLTRVEAYVEHLQGDVTELKYVVTKLGDTMMGEFKAVRGEMRENIQGSRVELREDIRGLRGDMNALHGEMRDDINALHVKMRDGIHGLRVEMRWLFGIMVIVVGSMVGGMYTLILKHLH